MWTPADPAIIAAQQEIAQVIYLYCRAMDQMDLELGYSLWTPDATVDYGAFKGTGREFIDKAASDHRKMQATSHQITNIIIDVDLDNMTANSEAYVLASLRDDREGTLKDRLFRGRYLDRWAIHDGRWRIAHRALRHDLTTVTPCDA